MINPEDSVPVSIETSAVQDVYGERLTRTSSTQAVLITGGEAPAVAVSGDGAGGLSTSPSVRKG